MPPKSRSLRSDARMLLADAPPAPLRRARVAACLAWVAILVLLAPRVVRCESAPIFLDGVFGDWTGAVEHVDPSGDGGIGADFRDVDLANDDAFLFLRFQTTTEVGIQANGNNLILYLDTDMNAGTGLAVGGIGAELQWNFGNRNGCFYPAGSCVAINQNAIRLRMLPSVTANTFEIAIGRDVRPTGSTLLFGGPTFRLLLRDIGGGDSAPNAGGLVYTFDATPVPPPAPLSFSRTEAPDVRIVTWNTRDLEQGAGFDPAVTPRADRVLSAIAPDIVCFQELYNTTAEQVRALVAGMLPERAPWYGAKQNDCAVVSRYPVLQSWALDGNLAVLLDSDAALDADLLLVCAHLPCCTEETGRQAEVDRIMSFFRDAMTAGGVVTVPAGTAFMIAGDLNLVGFNQQLETLLTGDIVNQGTFGPDFQPDWDGTALADVISSQTERRFAYTWRSDGSPFAPGRLDFVIYNDSVLRLRHHYIVYSPEMSPAELAATGIQAGDVTGVTDHIPHVADFRSVADVGGVVGHSAGGFSIRGSTVGHDAIHFTLELGFEATVDIQVFDAHGRVVQSLLGAGATTFGTGRHSLTWDGRSAAGSDAPSGVYFVRAWARPTAGGARQVTEGRWVLLH